MSPHPANRRRITTDNSEAGTVGVESIFGYQTKRGLVVLNVDEHQRAMEPAEARRIARMMLEAAESAEMDQLAWHWLSKLLGNKADEQQTAMMLLDFRKLRASLRQRERLHLEEGGEPARQDLLTRAELILSAIGISWDMNPPNATDRAEVREYLMEQLARCRAGDEPEGAYG